MTTRRQTKSPVRAMVMSSSMSRGLASFPSSRCASSTGKNSRGDQRAAGASHVPQRAHTITPRDRKVEDSFVFPGGICNEPSALDLNESDLFCNLSDKEIIHPPPNPIGDFVGCQAFKVCND